MNGKRLIFLCLIGALLFSVWSVASSFGAVTSVRHRLNISLDLQNHGLTAKDRVSLITEDGRISFNLAPQARIRSLTVEGRKVPYTFESGRALISPTGSSRKKGEVTLVIDYEATFRDTFPTAPFITEDPTYGVFATISSQGAFLLPSADWYPRFDAPHSSFRLQVTAHEGIKAVTEGRNIEHRTEGGKTVSVWEAERVSEGLALSAGPYEIRKSEADGIPVYTYFFPNSQHLADSYLEASTKYLRFYQERIGPYPFEKFAVVENFFPTGYGFPSYTLLGANVIRLPFIVKTSLGHEIAHCWWGNGVLVDYSMGNWSEGLTAYLSDYLFKEMGSAERAREHRLQILRDYATLVPPHKDFPLSRFTGRTDRSTQAVGYGKGAMVFHMLRRKVGDKAFWKGLQELYREKLFKKASWRDFMDFIGQSTGRDLHSFLDQWVKRTGAPVLALEGVSSKQTHYGWHITGRITQQKPYYDLQVPVRLETISPFLKTRVPLDDGEASFEFHSKAFPQRLVLDPEAHVFRRLHAGEIPPIINAIRGSSSLTVVVAENLPKSVQQNCRLLLKAFGQERALVVREENISKELLRTRDILYLGVPTKKPYLPPLPEKLDLSPNSFTLEGREYDGAEDVLFVALPHPEGAGYVAAVFLPFSSQGVLKVASKIPHYGKYSYLAFRDGVIDSKGIWPVEKSRTEHTFDVQELLQ